MIRDHKERKGIHVHGPDHRISQSADDTQLMKEGDKGPFTKIKRYSLSLGKKIRVYYECKHNIGSMIRALNIHRIDADRTLKWYGTLNCLKYWASDLHWI